MSEIKIVRPELTWWDALSGVSGALLIVVAWLGGLAMNLVNVLLMAYVPVGLATRVWAGAKGRLETGFIRRPFAPEYRWFLVQALVRWSFVCVWILVLRVSIVPAQLGESLRSIWIELALVCVVVALLPLVPKKRVLVSRLIFVGALLCFFGGQLVMMALPTSASEITSMDLPLRSEVLVLQGGRSPLVNHHFIFRSQRNALDLVVLKNGKFFDGNEADWSSYGCFGEPVHAPLSGTVVKVVDDRPDMPFGKMDREQIAGNNVVLQVGPERYVLFAHLKQGSVVVHEGEHVACGAVLAQCGNSGNTTAPHLHVQVQNRAEFTAPDLRTSPIVFRDHDAQVPRRNDRIKPADVMCQ